MRAVSSSPPTLPREKSLFTGVEGHLPEHVGGSPLHDERNGGAAVGKRRPGSSVGVQGDKEEAERELLRTG